MTFTTEDITQLVNTLKENCKVVTLKDKLLQEYFKSIPTEEYESYVIIIPFEYKSRFSVLSDIKLQGIYFTEYCDKTIAFKNNGFISGFCGILT